jgi:hypothetical protein
VIVTAGDCATGVNANVTDIEVTGRYVVSPGLLAVTMQLPARDVERMLLPAPLNKQALPLTLNTVNPVPDPPAIVIVTDILAGFVTKVLVINSSD